MATAIQVTCGHCNVRMQLPLSALNKRGHCHGCQHVGIIQLAGGLATPAAGRLAEATLTARSDQEPESAADSIIPPADPATANTQRPEPATMKKQEPVAATRGRQPNASLWSFNAVTASIIIGMSILMCGLVLWLVLPDSSSDTPVLTKGDDNDPANDGAQLPTPLDLVQSVSTYFTDTLERAESLNKLSRAQVIAGDSVAALKTLTGARESTFDIPYVPLPSFDHLYQQSRLEDEIYLLTEIALTEFKAGSKQRAHSTLQHVINKLRSFELHGFNWLVPRKKVVRILAQQGQFEAAMHVAYSSPSKTALVHSLLEIASAQVDGGQPWQARGTLDSALRQLPTVPPGTNRHFFRGRISIILSRAGQTQQAQSVISGIDDAQHLSPAHANLSAALAREERVTDGKTLARSIKSPYWKATAFHKIAKDVFRNGRELDAIICLEEVPKLAKAIASPKQRSTVFRESAEVWLGMGNQEIARKTVEKGVLAAKLIKHPADRRHILVTLASIMVRAGDINGARAIVTDDVPGFQTAFAQRDIALTMLECGETTWAAYTLEQAFQNAGGIPNQADRDALIVDIVSLQSRTGDIQTAVKWAKTIGPLSSRVPAIFEIAYSLATKDLSERTATPRENATSPRPLKSSFTAEEDRLAKELMDMMKAK